MVGHRHSVGASTHTFASRRPMQSCTDPRSWIIIAHLKPAANPLDPIPGAPPRYKRAGQRRMEEYIEAASLSTPCVPDGVISHPSAPQFSSSQAVIRAYRWPRPPGGTAILTRSGAMFPRSWSSGGEDALSCRRALDVSAADGILARGVGAFASPSM